LIHSLPAKEAETFRKRSARIKASMLRMLGRLASESMKKAVSIGTKNSTAELIPTKSPAASTTGPPLSPGCSAMSILNFRVPVKIHSGDSEVTNLPGLDFSPVAMPPCTTMFPAGNHAFGCVHR
jgi:hypothetical protein